MHHAAGGRQFLDAEHVISSAPLRELVHGLRPAPPPDVLAAGAALKYRDFLTVALIVRPSLSFDDNWIYVHEPGVKVGRIQNFRSWSPELVPDPALACYGLEYFCFEGDGLWTASDEELVAQAKREIGKIGLMDPADVYDACVVRQHKAYPVYDDAYAEHIKMIRLDLKMHFPGLHLVGRNGMHKYNNQDHAMMTGVLTAENIIAGELIHDVWEVNEDAEYGEAGVSGAREALRSERAVPKKVAA